MEEKKKPQNVADFKVVWNKKRRGREGEQELTASPSFDHKLG